MSDRNVLRRLVECLYATGTPVNRIHRTPINFVPVTDDSVVKWGDGTRSFDYWLYGNTASDYFLWDASASKLSMEGAAVLNVPNGQLQLASTAIDATAAEINKACDVSTRLVNVTATATLSAASHGGRIIKVSGTAALALSLPAATGSGEIYTFVMAVSATTAALTIKSASTLDNINGCVNIVDSTSTASAGFHATAASTTYVTDGTTKGGLKGNVIYVIDVATSMYFLSANLSGSGTLATGFA